MKTLLSFLTQPSYRKLWLAIFWIVLIALLYLTLTPSPVQTVSFKHIDKVFHFIAFAGFTFLLKVAFSKLSHNFVLSLSALLGIFIEIIQLYIPNRGFSYADMLADFLGSLFGLWFYLTLIKASQQHK
ncbi:VanZ family protein [Aliikangiella sp. IMCC44653]